MNSHLAVESGAADVNGTHLHYEMRGSGAALLFLHGFTLDRRMWRAQVERLASRYRVVTYDARGFGHSAMPDASAYKHCEDAAALCEHLGLRRVVAVGHSIGAHQMLELALSRPDLVAGFVSICMSGLAGVPFPEDVAKMFGAIRAAVRDEGVDAAKRIWSRCGWFEASREKADVARELDAMLEGYSGWHWTHDNPAKSIEPAAAERLGEMTAPSLVVAGGRDLPYNEAVASALLAKLPNATALRLPRAGHMASMEEPAVIADAIDSLAKRASY